jgi:hypothetical protein
MKSLITMIMNNKVLIYPFMLLSFFFAAANSNPAHAETMHNWTAGQPAYPTVVNAAPPQVRSGWDMTNVQTGQSTGVSVYSQNVTPVGFTTTVCAEQWTNGVKYHIGCVPEAPYRNASEGVSRFDFNAWPRADVHGTTTMVFTYRDSMGNWREILSPTYQQQRVTLGT